MQNPYPAAHASDISKWLLSGGVVFASIAYVLWQNLQGTVPVSVATVPVMQTVSSGNSMMGTAPPTPAAAAYINGSYLGDAVDVYYGIVQVRAVIQGGKLAAVQLVQYPNDREQTVFINSHALPMLVQEALQVQSAQVHAISGASETSGGFQASLATALANAKS